MSVSSLSRRGCARHATAGFTLVELLIVLAIIALIAAVAGPRVIGYLGKAKSSTAKVQIGEIGSALELYFLDNGKYPSQQSGLASLISKPADAPKWSGPYLKKADGLIDPWGKPYLYKHPGTRGEFDVLSYGADGAPGGEGDAADVTSW